MLYDRGTHSHWRQASGEALVGAFAGACPRQLPLLTVAWRTLPGEHPGARVLALPGDAPRARGYLVRLAAAGEERGTG